MTQKKKKYLCFGLLGVGISSVLEYLSTSCFRIIELTPNALTYIPSDVSFKISTVLFGYILFQEDRITPQCHSLHTIRCSLTQEIRIFMVKGWQTQRFSRYLDTFYRGWNIKPYCHGLHII
jgi:hypothetical protein